MRQAGIIAAPGIIAIEKMVDRLKDDHANAKILAQGLAKIEGISIDPSHVQTNILLYDVTGLGISSEEWIAKMKELGVKAGPVDSARVRMVTHRGIEKEDIEYTLSAAEKAASQLHKKK
jgi:threonine aldolase